jgi:PAS domain S-box-containing protein
MKTVVLSRNIYIITVVLGLAVVGLGVFSVYQIHRAQTGVVQQVWTESDITESTSLIKDDAINYFRQPEPPNHQRFDVSVERVRSALMRISQMCPTGTWTEGVAPQSRLDSMLSQLRLDLDSISGLVHQSTARMNADRSTGTNPTLDRMSAEFGPPRIIDGPMREDLVDMAAFGSIMDRAILDAESIEDGLADLQLTHVDRVQFTLIIVAIAIPMSFVLFLLTLIHLERGSRAVMARHRSLALRFSRFRKRSQQMRTRLQITQFSMNHITEAVLWMDRSGLLVYANEAACRMTGYSKEQLSAMHIWDLDPSHPEDVWAKAFEEIRQTKSVHLQTEHISGAGVRYPVQVTANYLETDGRQIVVSAHRDISELEMGRQLLDESKRQYQEVIESVDVGLCLVDPDLRFLFVNAKGDEIFGVPALTLKGRSLTEFISAADQVRLRGEVEKRRKGISSAYELEIYHPNGERRLLQVLSRPRVRDAEFIGSFAVIRDITDERLLANKHRELETRLQRAERMESLGLLAGGVAHDLNNMLSPIVGYPEMIVRKLPPESPVINWVRKMEKAAEQAADVIQDLLTLARRGRYQMKPTSINDVLKDFVDSPGFARTIERNPGVSFTLNVDPNIGAIEGSASHLAKTVMNIITNALEATSPGGSVSVTTYQAHLDRLTGGFEDITPGDYVVVRTVDTGSGIPKDEISKIFEPYFSKKRMGASGSGLGLAVVYGVVKDHKGYYDILSDVGKGTEFILYFPVSAKRAEIDEPTVVQGRLSGTRVLVAGDDTDMREMTVLMLQSLGIKPDAASIAEVENKLANDSFDVAVIDVPSGQAAQMCGRVHALRSKGIRLPLICMVDSLEAGDRDCIHDVEPITIVRKPAKAAAIGEAIQSALVRQRSTVQPAS